MCIAQKQVPNFNDVHSVYVHFTSIFFMIATATRLCNINSIWQSFDVTGCETDQYTDLLTTVQTNGPCMHFFIHALQTEQLLLSFTQISTTTFSIDATTEVVTSLATLTQPTKNVSILPMNLQNTNDVIANMLMLVNMYFKTF